MTDERDKEFDLDAGPGMQAAAVLLPIAALVVSALAVVAAVVLR